MRSSRREEQVVRLHILSFLGGERLVDPRPRDIAAWVRKLGDGKRAPHSTGKCHGVLSAKRPEERPHVGAARSTSLAALGELRLHFLERRTGTRDDRVEWRLLGHRGAVDDADLVRPKGDV